MIYSNSSEDGDHSRYISPDTSSFDCYDCQYLITLGFFPFNFFLGYVYLSPILTLFPPPHWCAVPALSHLSREERKELAIPRLETAGQQGESCMHLFHDQDRNRGVRAVQPVCCGLESGIEWHKASKPRGG